MIRITGKTKQQLVDEVAALRKRVAELEAAVVEGKQVEKALRESEERFSIASRLATDLLYERDLVTGAATFYGDVDERMGFEPGGFPRTADAWAELVHPDDLTKALESLASHLSAGDRASSEYRLRRKDGSFGLFLDRFEVIRDPKTGDPVRMMGVATDVSELKWAEEQLRRSEEKYRAVFHEAGDGIALIDFETGLIQECNPEFERQTGRSLDQLRKLTPWELRPPQYVEAARAKYLEFKAKGSGGSAELPFLKPDGEVVPVEFRARVVTIGAERCLQTVTRDLTGRRQAEEALRESEENFRALAEHSLDCIVVFDSTGVPVYANDRAAELTGLGPDDLMAFDLGEFFDRDEAERLQERMKRRMAGEEVPNYYDTTIVRKGGQRVPVEVSAALTVWRGNPAAMAVFRDVTERRRAEEKLRESQAKLQLVLDSTLEGIALVDLNGTTIDVNERLVQMVGAGSKDELVGRSSLAYLAEGDVQRAMAGMQSNLKSGVATLQEHRLTRHDGSELLVEGSGRLVRDASGNPVGFVSVVRDITGRKLAEAELRLRDTAMEDSLSAIAMADMEGRITYVNKACMRLWGSDNKEELLGKPYWALAEAREAGKEIARAMLQKGSWEGEVVARNKDGREFTIRVASALVADERGNPTHTISSFLDVTERRKAEEAVRTSERRYRLLAENARDIIWTADLNLYPTYVSPSVEHLLGYSPEEASSQPITRLVTPVALDAALNVLRTELERERAGLGPSVWGRVIESEVYHKDGHTIWVETRLAFLHDQNGQPNAILGITRDVTDRKKAEQELRDSEAHFSALVGNLTDAVFEFKGGVVVWCNDRVEEIYGYTREELLGKPATFFYPRHMSPQQYVKMVSAAIKERGFFRGRDESRRKDGSGVHVEYSLAQIPGKDPIELIAIGRDVTDRVHAEDALRRSEREFRSVLENSRDMIHRLNLETRTWDYVSPASKELLGYSPEECKALGFDGMLALVHPDDMGKLQEDLKELATLISTASRDEASVTSEYRFKHKELGYRWLSDSRSVVRDERNRPVAVVGAVRDVTERKQYSEQLERTVEQRTRQLKDAQEQLVRRERLAVLGQLAGGIGHELRNPLGAIKNAAYFLNMALEKPDAEVKETLGIVDREVATCERIISSLLDFARQRLPVRRKCDLNSVVLEALSRTRVPEEVEVVTRLDETLPSIMADPAQLGQVFGNILLNAVQSMPKGGRLAVESGARGPGWVAVSIADTGVGIPSENTARLFEPLFSTKARGIGLGLPLSKTIVEAHGGSVEVQTEVGKGSTFTVKLPVGG